MSQYFIVFIKGRLVVLACARVEVWAPMFVVGLDLFQVNNSHRKNSIERKCNQDFFQIAL